MGYEKIFCEMWVKESMDRWERCTGDTISNRDQKRQVSHIIQKDSRSLISKTEFPNNKLLTQDEMCCS